MTGFMTAFRIDSFHVSCLISARTHSFCEKSIAKSRAFLPSAARNVTSAFHCSSNFTTSTWPRWQPRCRGATWNSSSYVLECNSFFLIWLIQKSFNFIKFVFNFVKNLLVNWEKNSKITETHNTVINWNCLSTKTRKFL